ncbi:hypothetical protein RDI58_010228 [Solanum bulbocastanum]|uniref:Uncharacterized protein n=1 Tax=Solanum bulbocastanum TaxID=147425 RepID=A0AAN8TTM9_SOLBU
MDLMFGKRDHRYIQDSRTCHNFEPLGE